MVLDIDRLLRTATQESPAQMVYDAIRDAMWPFRTDVWTWMGDQYEVDYNRYKIYIEIRVFPDDVLIGHVPMRDVNVDPTAAFETLARIAFMHFRRLRQEPEDNIILGDN